jgi:hypothetical protein
LRKKAGTVGVRGQIHLFVAIYSQERESFWVLIYLSSALSLSLSLENIYLFLYHMI